MRQCVFCHGCHRSPRRKFTRQRWPIHETRACGADEPMSAVAFSGDGSLVAAAVPGSVALWDPAANSLVAVLAHPAAASSVAVSSLKFVPSTPYLVSTLQTSVSTLDSTATVTDKAIRKASGPPFAFWLADRGRGAATLTDIVAAFSSSSGPGVKLWNACLLQLQAEKGCFWAAGGREHRPTVAVRGGLEPHNSISLVVCSNACQLPGRGRQVRRLRCGPSSGACQAMGPWTATTCGPSC